jgi:hypothetical protein
MSVICKRMTSSWLDEVDRRPVVVAFERGMFNCCFSGHAPGPVQGLRRALRERGTEVHDVKGDYTSQLCSSFDKKVKALCTECGKDGGGKEVYGVRRCLTVMMLAQHHEPRRQRRLENDLILHGRGAPRRENGGVHRGISTTRCELARARLTTEGD